MGTTSVAPMELSARIVTLDLAETFVISRGATETEHVAQVELRYGSVSGFGEAAPVDYHGETAESALAYLEEHAGVARSLIYSVRERTRATSAHSPRCRFRSRNSRRASPAPVLGSRERAPLRALSPQDAAHFTHCRVPAVGRSCHHQIEQRDPEHQQR